MLAPSLHLPLRPICIFTLSFVLGTAAVRAADYADFVTGSFSPSLNPAFFALSKTEQVSLASLGSFQTTISTTGAAWGVETFVRPPTGVAIDPSWVDPAFPGNLNGLTVLGFLGGIGQTVTVSFNFTSLNGGFLPAGSLLAYNDIDGTEMATFTTSSSGWYSLSPGQFYQAGVNIGSPWGTLQPPPGPRDIPSTIGSTATQLKLTGPGAVTDGVTNFFVTQTDLTSLTISATGSPGMQFAQAVAIGVIPEPSGALLLWLAGIFSLAQRRRR